MPPSKHPHDPPAPAWLNIAAVVALIAFITGGVLTLRHFSKPDPVAQLPWAGDTGSRSPNTPTLIRPGGADSSIDFVHADVTDADDFRRLAEQDPRAAAALISHMEDEPMRDERLFDLMQIWAQNNAPEAAEWVTGLPIGALKNDATAELGLAWGETDPTTAASWVEQNIFTENAPAGAASLTSAWARDDMDAVTDWVLSLDPEAPARADAIKTLAFHLGELDPQRGLSWLSQLSDTDRELVAVNFAAAWADHQPRAAAEWLRFQSANIDPRTRDQATLAVIHSWSANEKIAATAGTWIDQLEDSDLKENCKATFAETHSQTSPTEALPWALALKDPERRLDTSLIVLEEWITQTPEVFKTQITDRWESFDEATRHGVYDLLLDHDPAFKDELYNMFENRDTGGETTPAEG